MIDEKQTKQCSDALIEWFKSQDCDPADGLLVMFYLIATQLVAKTTDINELQKAIKLGNLMLTLNISNILKDKGL